MLLGKQLPDCHLKHLNTQGLGEMSCCMITNLRNSCYAAFRHEVLKEIQTPVSWSGLKAELVRNKAKRRESNSQDAVVTCRIVETSIGISASPLSYAGNSVAAEGALDSHSSSARAQKAPPPPEYENLCLLLLQLECKEHCTSTLIEQNPTHL